MEFEDEEKNHVNEQNIRPNNPIYASGSSTDNNSIKDWWSIFFMLMPFEVDFVYFEIIVYENQTFCIIKGNYFPMNRALYIEYP